jgi:hypothetical protein
VQNITDRRERIHQVYDKGLAYHKRAERFLVDEDPNTLDGTQKGSMAPGQHPPVAAAPDLAAAFVLQSLLQQSIRNHIHTANANIFLNPLDFNTFIRIQVHT